jgi:aryl-alcohol dehydrogenase-like predicted oxidoreductase
MEYRKLGRSGLKVSPICLGTMMFGEHTDEKEAGRIVASAREAGINFIDTADAYVKGTSEQVVGRLIKKERDHWVLATKVCNPMGEGPNQQGLARKWVMQAVDASLKRLQTDYIDVYYYHKVDPDTSLAEMAEVAADLVRQGKIRYVALSNFRAWQIAEFVNLSRSIGGFGPVCLQPYYNAMNRMPEIEVLPACQFYGLGVVPYSPLARGVLTGKYEPGKEPPKGTRAARKDRRMMQTEFRKESLHMAQRIKKHAEKRGMTAGQFALNWVLNNSIISSVIAGPRTFAHWKEYLGALDHSFSKSDEALVDRMVAAGHPSTPGFNDPAYPLTGRAPRSG